MKRGWNWLQFMWANTLIDPTSLSLVPLQSADEIEIEQLVFPPRLPQVGRWLVKSNVSGRVPFDITYLTSGLSWQASYMGTMSVDEKVMTMQGCVRVTNHSGEDCDNAQTRLVVGKVHILDQIAQLAKRKHPYSRPEIPAAEEDDEGERHAKNGGFHYRQCVKMLDDFGDDKEIKKEGLSEYFLYTIVGTETIPNGWGKRLPSLDVSDIPVVSLYKYDEERWGQKSSVRCRLSKTTWVGFCPRRPIWSTN
jgi:hypothetical protein